VHTPDVVLLSQRLGTIDAVDATFQIVAADPFHKINVIIIADSYDTRQLAHAVQSGACAIVKACTRPGQLLGTIHAVAGGDTLVVPRSVRRLLAGVVRRPTAATSPTPDLATLTEREREVMRLAVEGLTNDEIADRLFISSTTVKSHLGHVLAKLGVTSRARLIALVYENGLIDASPSPSATTAGRRSRV
jgi:DNA-binding NarL/FixJ family response regulator